jgi:hypothetical protein
MIWRPVSLKWSSSSIPTLMISIWKQSRSCLWSWTQLVRSFHSKELRRISNNKNLLSYAKSSSKRLRKWLRNCTACITRRHLRVEQLVHQRRDRWIRCWDSKLTRLSTCSRMCSRWTRKRCKRQFLTRMKVWEALLGLWDLNSHQRRRCRRWAIKN